MSSNDWNGLVPSVIMRYIIITLITLIFISINANALTPTVNSTHFLIYDLANAGSSYDQALDNYLEQAYSLYTNTLGMKMSPPCSGSQYTVYVVSSLPGSEAGVTGWEYTYNPNTGQIISTCIEYINISAGLSSDWLEHTAYHELVHVSQLAYMQYTTIPQDYPWYIEADAEGTASYYTNQCPMAQDYFQYNQYGYDPYDYSGEPIINMYYYSAFIYWLIANGIGPATIEQNVFAGNSIINSWLDNYYTQYLVSLVHGQNLCGSTYYPSFQTISMSGSTYSFSVSLQGLSAQYYKVQLPATGTIEITAGGGSVISNIELNSAFSITNTTLYMALVNPTTNNETVTLTISYTPGITARIVGGTYNVMTESLTLNLYVMYGTAPITGTIYINGTPTSASNGYASATFTGITWGTYVVNVTYENSTALTYITLGQPTASLVTTTTLYLTSNSFGNLVISVNNPNSVTLVTDMLITSPPSPINPYKPMIYFEPPNTTLILGPGTSTIKINFVVNSTVSNGQGDIYIYNSPSTALSLGYDVVPVQVSIINATYYINGNYTIVDTYVNDVGKMNFVIGGFTGTVYINYSTYTITTLKIGVVSPTVRLLPEIVLLAPSWALVNTTIELMTPNSCPSFPVFYYGEFYVNNTYVGSKLVSCGSIGVVWNLLNETYTGQYMVLSVAGMNIMANISIVPPLINVVNYLWNITSTNEYVIVNLSIYGPYEYAVLSHYVNNSTLQLTYSLPANYTMLTINTGFGNITVSRPTPLISLESPAVTIYPQPINAVINITMPPTCLPGFIEYVPKWFIILINHG
ncbi:hypothetical protein [Vulcanisaeta sp. JCM 16159]|uniref:hypothetical protein n=1 Tax=Vulcanisaeta sp. JCM 16159 TaxID=1295371 RepID=UPI001FB34141|nr:hypothetical protein [Vulcanisaeta sp. JCM 16159]